MQPEPTPWEVQTIFYKPNSERYCLISFDGIKYYTFKVRSIIPHFYVKKLDYIIQYRPAEYMRCNGYYNKDEKAIYIFYDRKVYKEYQQIVNRQKLDRLKQSYLAEDTEGEKQKMSYEEINGIKSGRVDLDEAPEFIVPTKIVSEIKEDPKDKVKCLYVDFYWMEGEEELTLTMKYRPFHAKVLLERMTDLKIKNITSYTGKKWALEKKPFGTLGYPHYLPALKE